jgi:hypothetical protein
VVPEPEAPTKPDVPQGIPSESPAAGSAVQPANVEDEVPDVATGSEDAVDTIVVPESLPHVLMTPADIATPTWTYTAPGAGANGDNRRLLAVVVLAFVVGLLAIALVATLSNSGTVRPRIVAGNLGDYTLPGSGGQPGPNVTTDQPGTYVGIVRVRADGAIRLRASGDIRLRIDGIAHIVASGDVKVSGDGVVNSISSARVRVRGNGTIRITVGDGRIRLRLQGTVTARGDGTVRIGGVGRFLITHRPV